MRALVTGGDGFIGSHLVRALLKAGYNVTAMANLQQDYGRPERLRDVWKDIRFFLADVRNFNKVTAACHNVDIVFHLAAMSHVPVCERNPFLAWETNTLGTVNVLEACRSGGKRLLYAGTDHIYDSQAEPLSEGAPILGGHTVYGLSKVQAVQLCNLYHRIYGLDVRILVSSNVFGEAQDGGKVIPIFIERALANRELVVDGGSQVGDFYHVSNLVDAYLHVAKLDNAAGETYHVGSGRGRTVEELANEIISRCGRGTISRGQYRWDTRPDKCWIMDTRKIEATGWKLRVSFEEGLERTIGYYKTSVKVNSHIS